MKFNPAKLDKLKALSLDGGLEYFRQYLGQEFFSRESAATTGSRVCPQG